MNVSGIIVEYNPFHNGHLYHINQTKTITNPDVLVAVCSGNYNQRGDLSIINKFQKTKAALENGVDLVVELPYIYTLQNAYKFAYGAITILKILKCNNLVFGSETNNLEELKKYAELEVDITRLKELLHDGHSYPKAYGLLSSYLYPNDMLAVAYLKALKDSNIKAYSILRTNEYLKEDIDIISSATAIRKAYKNHQDISFTTPIKINEAIYNEDLYPFIRKLLFVSKRKDLQKIFLTDEGIEKVLMENAIKYSNYDDFISHSISRRYTKSKIQRTILHIANQVTKEEVDNLGPLDYVRVLGFNSKGQSLLKELKDDKRIITQFKKIPENYKNIEWRSSLLYSSLLKNQNIYLKQELKGPIIIE